MSLPNWINSHGQSNIELRIATNEVLVILIPKEPKKIAQAAIVSLQQISLMTTDPNVFSNWIKTIHNNVSEGQFRLIGDSNVFKPLERLFVAKRFQPGKHVALKNNEGSIFHFLPQERLIRMMKKESSPELKAAEKPGHHKVRVLVVDDSQTIRTLLKNIINQDPELECVDAIDKPSKALEAIQKHKPDVMTLDIHMPEMNGVELLKKIIPVYPIPTIMVTALSKEDGTYVLDGLEAGAVDYIQKPSLSEVDVMASVICEKIKSARLAKIKHSKSPIIHKHQYQLDDVDHSYLICIGSSTGGTEALKSILTRFPAKIPPVLIVQHIPTVFSKAFADRINQLCPFEVKEAEDGDHVTSNTVYIAPGGKQMKVFRYGGIKDEIRIIIEDSPPVNRHKPSVDFLFDSVAVLQRQKVVATILTGMGSDGAKGLLKLKECGAKTFAQDEASSVVYGMPKEAARLGAAQQIVSLNDMPYYLIESCCK
jgi:two-component system chemotaxis response regulator CheB